jgi:hypothetical protein
MTAHANLPLNAHADASLEEILAWFSGHEDKALSLVYPDGTHVQAGYHITEVKAGSFVTLDCGGNPDAWNETVLQVEDIPSRTGEGGMSVGKFVSILARVAGKISLSAGARVTIEAGPPGEPMRIHDVASVEIEGGKAILRLAARPAICKPRHREAQGNARACCGAAVVDNRNSCCA